MNELIYDEELADQQRRALQRQTMLQQWAEEIEQQGLQSAQTSQPFNSEAGMPIEQAIQSVLGNGASQGVPTGGDQHETGIVSQSVQSNTSAQPNSQVPTLNERLANRRNEFSQWLDGKVNSQPYAWRWLDQHPGQSNQTRTQAIPAHIDRWRPGSQSGSQLPSKGTNIQPVGPRHITWGGPPPQLRLPKGTGSSAGSGRNEPWAYITYFPPGIKPGNGRRSSPKGLQRGITSFPGVIIN